MEVVETGTVVKGEIALDRRLPMKDGAKAVVRVAEVSALPQTASRLSDREFCSLEFFGQWAGRPELGSSEDFVRQVRIGWACRPRTKY
jgi:hypothetical protein